MRRTLSLTALWTLLGLTLPLPGLSQSIPSPYRFVETRQEGGLFVGVLSPGRGRFGYGPGPGTALGARYAIRVSGPFALEGVAILLPTTRDLIDPGRDEGDRKVGEVDSRLLILDVRLRFDLTGPRTWHGLTPFVLAGGGFALDIAPDPEAQEEPLLLADDRFRFGNSFTGLLGGGIAWFPVPDFVVRLDAGLFIWQLRSPSGFRNPERGFEGVEEKEWVSGPSLTLGGAIRF